MHRLRMSRNVLHICSVLASWLEFKLDRWLRLSEPKILALYSMLIWSPWFQINEWFWIKLNFRLYSVALLWWPFTRIQQNIFILEVCYLLFKLHLINPLFSHQGFLSSALLAMLLTTLIAPYTPFVRSLVVWGGLAINCGFVVYDTQLIAEKCRRGDRDYIWHTVTN